MNIQRLRLPTRYPIYPIHARILLAFIRPRQYHRSIKVDDLVIQPSTRSQPRQILIRHLFPSKLGHNSSLFQDRVYFRVVLGRERGWQRDTFWAAQTSLDFVVFGTVRNLELVEGWVEGFWWFWSLEGWKFRRRVVDSD